MNNRTADVASGLCWTVNLLLKNGWYQCFLVWSNFCVWLFRQLIRLLTLPVVALLYAAGFVPYIFCMVTMPRGSDWVWFLPGWTALPLLALCWIAAALCRQRQLLALIGAAFLLHHLRPRCCYHGGSLWGVAASALFRLAILKTEYIDRHYCRRCTAVFLSDNIQKKVISRIMEG